MPEEIKVYGPEQPKGRTIMKQKGLTLSKLAGALGIYQLSLDYELKTYLGLNENGFYASHVENWEDGDFVTFIPWVQIYEILGMVEVGTTGEFMEGGAEFN